MIVEFDGKIITIDKKIRVRELLKELNLNLETYLVTINDSLATHDELIEKDDRVRIIRVVSGG